ncbi:MAG: DMT family transporter [Anaerolineales bacterium]|nr:DMT family transporter [Anaerolineales bacterium]
MNILGEIAGLATSFFFALNAVVLTSVGKMVGSQVTNRVRLVFALVYLIAINLILFNEPLPFSADSSHWVWLSISGVIGFALGDAFLFKSYVMIGPRLGSLMMSLAPIFGSLIAWVIFGETLSPLQILGMSLALAGIVWVVTSHKEAADTPRRHTRTGVIFGVLAGLGQAMGLVLSKQGMANHFHPFQANAIRLLAATVFIILWMLIERKAGATVQVIRENPASIGLLALGALIGPVLGVSASLLAVQLTEVGVASTLTSLAPVLLLPISYFALKEKISWQGVAGTILAIAGVAVLFLAK